MCVCVCLYRIKYSLYMIWTRQCRSCPADAPTDQCLFGAKAKPGNPCRGSITQGARPYRGSSKPTLTCPQNARKKKRKGRPLLRNALHRVFHMFSSSLNLATILFCFHDFSRFSWTAVILSVIAH